MKKRSELGLSTSLNRCTESLSTNLASGRERFVRPRAPRSVKATIALSTRPVLLHLLRPGQRHRPDRVRRLEEPQGRVIRHPDPGLGKGEERKGTLKARWGHENE